MRALKPSYRFSDLERQQEARYGVWFFSFLATDGSNKNKPSLCVSVCEVIVGRQNDDVSFQHDSYLEHTLLAKYACYVMR